MEKRKWTGTQTPSEDDINFGVDLGVGFSDEFLREFHRKYTAAGITTPEGDRGLDHTGELTGKMLNGIGRTFHFTATVVLMVANVHNHIFHLINKLKDKAKGTQDADSEYWEKQWAEIESITGRFMRGVCTAELAGVRVIELAGKFFTAIAGWCNRNLAKEGLFKELREDVTTIAASLNTSGERLRAVIESHREHANKLTADADAKLLSEQMGVSAGSVVTW